MKRIVVLVLCVVSVIAVAEVTITDVKPSSDAYEAVKRVVEAGVMSLDEKNRFLGTLLVTRYDLARSLSNLMSYLESRIRVEEINKALSDVETRIKVIEAFANVTQTELESIRGELGSLKDTQSSLRAELTGKIDELSAMMDAKVKAFQGEFSKALDEIRAELDSQSDEISALESRLGNLEKSSEMMGDTLSASLSHLSVNVRANRMALESFKTEISNVKKSLNDVIGSLSAQLDGVRRDLQGRLDTAVASLTTSQTSMREDFEATLLEFNALLATVKEDTISLSKRFDTLESSITRAIRANSKEIAMNTERVLELDSGLRDLRSQIDNISQHLENATKSISRLSKDLSLLSAELRDTKQDVKVLLASDHDQSKALSDLNAELQRLKMEFADVQTKLEEIETLKSGLSSTSREITGLKGKTDTLGKELADVKSELEETRSKVREVSTQSLILMGASALLGLILGAGLAWIVLAPTR